MIRRKCKWIEVRKCYQRIVPICLFGGPWKSSLILCSKIQTTTPTTRKKTPVTHHNCGVNGLRNAQALEFNFLIGATTTRPESIYGCEIHQLCSTSGDHKVAYCSIIVLHRSKVSNIVDRKQTVWPKIEYKFPRFISSLILCSKIQTTTKCLVQQHHFFHNHHPHREL